MPKDQVIKTDEMLHQERKNLLVNKIRKYFFGAPLKTSFEMINQLASKAVLEQDEMIASYKKKPDIQQKIRERKNELSEKVALLNKIFPKLEKEKPESPEDYVTNDELENMLSVFKPQYRLREDANIKTGTSEGVLNSLFKELGDRLEKRCDDEMVNHHNISFTEQMLRASWVEKIHKYVQDHPISDSDSAPDDVVKNIENYVTALYKGDLEEDEILEGLELHDFMNDKDAPAKTARQIVKVCGFLALVNDGEHRSRYMSHSMNRYNNDRQLIDNAADADVLFDIVKSRSDMSNAWSHYKNNERYFLYGSLKNSDPYLSFSELNQTREIVKNNLDPDRERAENRILDEYKKYWRAKKIGDKDYVAAVDATNRHTLAMDEDSMARGIAAHLCSAYYELDNREKSNQDLAVFKYHTVKRPVNDAVIEDTINYFKEIFPEEKLQENIFAALDKNKIRKYYDAAILNREAKKQIDEDAGEFTAYLRAMKYKVGDSNLDEATMICPMKSGKGRNPWENYVYELLECNKSFRDAVEAHCREAGGSKPTLKNLTDHFVSEYKYYCLNHDGPFASEKPDFEEHNEKIRKLDQKKIKFESLENFYKRFDKQIRQDIEFEEGVNADNIQWQSLWKGFQEGHQADPSKKLVDIKASQDSYRKFLEKEDVQTKKEELNGLVDKAVSEYKKKNDDLTKQYKNMLETVHDASKHTSEKSMLETLVKGIGGSSNVQEARAALIDLADKARRNFIFVFLRMHRNETSTALRNSLNKLAKMKEGQTISKEELYDIRVKALELKNAIDQGRVYKETEQWVKKLSDVDKARYTMATTIIANTGNMMKEDSMLYKAGEEEFTVTNENPVVQ